MEIHMKKNNQSFFIISCVMVLTSITLYGCSAPKVQQEPSSVEPTTLSTDQADVDSTSVSIVSDDSAEIETKPITITVVNLSTVDVGMFSVFDPQLNQQTDVNEIAADGTLSFSCNWPVDITDLQWAVYDTQGDLLLESTTDITECKELMSILLSGESTIDDVDVLFN